MPNQITVAEIKRSMSGKSSIINGMYYAKNELADSLKVGQTINAEIETSEYKGKEMQWINAYVVTGTSHVPTSPAKTDMFWLPFVSNTVAHAIAAQLIKTPEDILVWVLAAKGAAVTASNQDSPDTPF